MFSGILAVVLAYFLGTTALLYLGAAISWAARGAQGTYQQAYTAVASYLVPEGVVIVNLALASTIVMAMLAVRWFHGRSPAWLASVRPGMRKGYLACAAVVALVVLNGLYLLLSAHGHVTWDPMRHAWLWMLLVVLTSPLQAAGEEYLFRGYLQQIFGAITGRWWVASLLSALIFAAMHGTQNIPLFVDRLSFGLIAGALVVVTGGLEASIAAHAVNNVSSFGYAIAAGTLSQTRQITVTTWGTTANNMLGYLVTGVLAVLLARLFRLKRLTPAT